VSAWPQVQAWIDGSSRVVDVLAPARAEDTLKRLQLSESSTLGAVVRETGGILVDRGFMRLLGGGSEQLPSIAEWAGLGDAALVEPVDRGLCVALDAVGGFFVLLAQTRRVHSFLPDTLDWQDTGLGYSQFVHWTLHGDLDDFYGDLRGFDWHGLAPDRALSIHEAAGTTRPVTELWALYPGGKLRELLEAR
jgi:hypothetical protein